MFWRRRDLKIGLSSSTGNRRETVIVSLTRTCIVFSAAILALALAAPAAQSTGPDRATAQIAKKCKKKK